ncbi:hypothetical protein Bca4012_031120 [Brassica carinata]
MALFVLMRALKLVVKVTCSQAHVSAFQRNFNLRLVGQTVAAFELWWSTSARYLFDKASLPHDEFTTTKGVAVGSWNDCVSGDVASSLKIWESEVMSLIARDKLAVTSTSSSLKKAISSATGQVQAHLCSLERQDEPVLCFLCSARAASESSRSSYYILHMEGSWKLELRWESNITVSIITATPLTSATDILQSSCEEISGRSSHAPSVVTSLSSVSTKEPELDTQRQLYLQYGEEQASASATKKLHQKRQFITI